MSNLRRNSSGLRRYGRGSAALAVLALLSATYLGQVRSRSVAEATVASKTPHPAERTGHTASPTPAGMVVSPDNVASIVAADTAINNRANASLSIALQNSHETCLQQILDDATYRGDLAATGSGSIGGSFNQVPNRSLVPRETTYPAFFSVLAENRDSSQPTTNNLLTYVKASASANWKLASSSEILGPTSSGVPVPAVATDAAGYATSLAPATPDGLAIAPGDVARRLASAFTSEAATGKLPRGISAEFGPNGGADPHSIAASFAQIGKVTTQFTATTPPAAVAGAPSPACPYPAFRLSDGGALVTFAIFSRTVVVVPAGEVAVQPPNRSMLGLLLPAGRYTSITLETGDIGVAIVPPSGSSAPIDVIGQASEGLSETGVAGAGSPSSVGAGGPSDASSIARAVDAKVVDINTTLNIANEKAAGTGIVLTSAGEVLTNNHVIEGATSISVTDVGNGKTYRADLVGYDRSSDVAVLKLENASGLAAVSLGDSSSVHTGEAVVGIGNAGGTGGTPSYAGGSVVAINRSITASDESDTTSEQLTGLIESNADIQPGDSGGPLVNAAGKVIGMDTAASAGFSFGQGASATEGYAIPIDTALKIARAIVAGKSSSLVHIGPTAFLGVNVAPVSRGGFGRFGQPLPAPTAAGAEIESIVSSSPASQAGLSAGDTITSLGGRSVRSPTTLTTIIASEKPGASLSLVYVDPSGTKHTVTVQLASGPPQ